MENNNALTVEPRAQKDQPCVAPLNGCVIRRFRPEDANGVARLIEAVYGHTYYPRDLYDPEAITRLNAAGKLISVLALDSSDRVIGHYALERPQLGPIAESSDAIVAPEFRHHHIMEQMRVLLREEAVRAGLIGLVGYPVTNHVYSQKAEEHFGAHPCALALGLWPRSFHNMPEGLTQRMSFVLYFKYLRPTDQVVHVATHHDKMLSRICMQYGIPVRRLDDAPPEGPGRLAVEHEPAVDTGTIRVSHVGADTAEDVRQAKEKLCGQLGAKALTLELPLAQVGTCEASRAAEEEGFFFCGLGPAHAADGDALLMQYLAEDLDPSLLQIESPLAKEMLDYTVREWERVRNKSVLAGTSRLS
jgi:hypothetical protein